MGVELCLAVPPVDSDPSQASKSASQRPPSAERGYANAESFRNIRPAASKKENVFGTYVIAPRIVGCVGNVVRGFDFTKMHRAITVTPFAGEPEWSKIGK